MAKTVIYKEHLKKERQFFRDGLMIGMSRGKDGICMDEIVVYQNDAPKYSLREDSRVFWFFYHWLYPVSCAVQLLLAHRYKVFEDGKEIGFSKEKRTEPPRTFLIHDDEYRLFEHKGNQFSLTKNGIQVALYAKRPEEMLKCKPDTYDIDYDQDEAIEIIELFCLFVDMIFFTPMNGMTNIKVIVPSDPYPHHTLWQPKE